MPKREMRTDNNLAKIRKGQIEDIQGLLDCQKSVWESLRDFLSNSWVNDVIERLSQTEAEERLQRRLEDPNRITIVAEEDKKIVGLALGSINLWKVSQMGFIGVCLPYRRKGIGRNLIEEYINESKLKGAHKISLNTAPTLIPAIRLYIELGFVPEGLLRQHAYGTDIIIYSKFLT